MCRRLVEHAGAAKILYAQRDRWPIFAFLQKPHLEAEAAILVSLLAAEGLGTVRHIGHIGIAECRLKPRQRLRGEMCLVIGQHMRDADAEFTIVGKARRRSLQQADATDIVRRIEQLGMRRHTCAAEHGEQQALAGNR